jgi:hypothetical protein
MDGQHRLLQVRDEVFESVGHCVVGLADNVTAQALQQGDHLLLVCAGLDDVDGGDAARASQLHN